MILLKVTHIRKRLLTLSILVMLVCLLAGTRANAQGDDLIKAAHNGDLPRVKALVAAGAEVNATLGNGFTALMAASQNGHLETVFQLPTSFAPIMMPSSMSINRDRPLQITVFPGGGSWVRAR